MSNVAIEYYEKKFGNDVTKAFVRLVREVGEIALAIERNNIDLAKMEITESVALLQFMTKNITLICSQTLIMYILKNFKPCKSKEY